MSAHLLLEEVDSAVLAAVMTAEAAPWDWARACSAAVVAVAVVARSERASRSAACLTASAGASVRCSVAVRIQRASAITRCPVARTASSWLCPGTAEAQVARRGGGVATAVEAVDGSDQVRD